MKVLVACEYSGVVRDAFIAKGHDAMSCDLLPTESEGPHYQGDVRDVISSKWDLMIAHPDCRYLTSSAEWAYGDGPYHQNVKHGTLVGEARRAARNDALDFVRELMSAPIKMIAIENPGRGAINTQIDAKVYGFNSSGPSQIIHPHQFGHDASKGTGLWLKNLRKLSIDQKNQVPGRCVGFNKHNKPIYRWANQTDNGQNRLPPSSDRWKSRAETYKGIATAMADQWGGI
jgi:hypothetical protein